MSKLSAIVSLQNKGGKLQVEPGLGSEAPIQKIGSISELRLLEILCFTQDLEKARATYNDTKKLPSRGRVIHSTGKIHRMVFLPQTLILEYEKNKAAPIFVNLAKPFDTAINISKTSQLDLNYTPLSFSAAFELLERKGLLVPSVHHLQWGDLRRRFPVDANYGFGRGTPIDRFYLDIFLRKIKKNVCGKILEIGADQKRLDLKKYKPGARFDSLDIEGKSKPTFTANAEVQSILKPRSYDSILAFNVLGHCRNPFSVTKNMHTWLRPGGIAFCAVSSSQRVGRCPEDCWKIQPDGLRALFSNFRKIQIISYGNLTTTIGALQGLAAEELSKEELLDHHPDYPVLSCVIAEK